MECASPISNRVDRVPTLDPSREETELGRRERERERERESEREQVAAAAAVGAIELSIFSKVSAAATAILRTNERERWLLATSPS